MNSKQFFDLLIEGQPSSTGSGSIIDFVAADSPHKKIGQAYDKASGKYDDYLTGDNFALKMLKKLALGMDKEALDICASIVKSLITNVGKGVVLDIPAGTGLLTFDEYVKHPNILFVAAEYSLGMLEKAKERIDRLNARNILLVRADVGALPFRSDMFDAVLCLNGIHSFPEKGKAIAQMARVLKKDKKIHGSLILRGERLLTDLVLELAYYRLLWFTKPALSRRELIDHFEKNELKFNSLNFLKSAAAFEAVKT